MRRERKSLKWNIYKPGGAKGCQLLPEACWKLCSSSALSTQRNQICWLWLWTFNFQDCEIHIFVQQQQNGDDHGSPGKLTWVLSCWRGGPNTVQLVSSCFHIVLRANVSLIEPYFNFVSSPQRPHQKLFPMQETETRKLSQLREILACSTSVLLHCSIHCSDVFTPASPRKRSRRHRCV